MRCPSCGQYNEESNRFCIFCGADMQPAPGEADDSAPVVPDDPASLESLQRELAGLRRRVDQIDATLGRIGIPVSSTTSGAAPSRPAPASRTAAQAGRSTEPASAALSSRLPPRPPRQRVAMPWDRVDWEVVLGGNWLARIGVVAVVFGVAFFLKLAIDSGWLGEAERVILGIVVGLGLLGAGEYWRTRYPVYSQALGGGAIAVLYLSVFAASAMFGLIPNIYASTALLFLISVTAAALAMRHESVALAVIGVAGAFSAPFLLSGFGGGGGATSQGPPLMVYTVVVAFGVLMLSTFRNWRWLTLLGLVGSLSSFGLWYDAYGYRDLLASQLGLTAIFLIFVAATTLFHVIWRRAFQPFDQALMVINAAAYFGISYGLLSSDFRSWMGGFTLLLALFYGGIAYLAVLRSREQVYLSFMSLGTALVFMTIAVPVQLSGPWVSVAWAIEGAVLMWLSFNLGMWQLRVFSLVSYALFAATLFFIDTPTALRDSLTPFWNEYFPSYALGIAATYLGAFLIAKNRSQLTETEEGLFDGLVRVFVTAGNAMLTIALATQVDGIWIAVAWAVEATVLIWLSNRLRFPYLKLSALGVFALMAGRLMFFDTGLNLRDLETFVPFINLRMLAFVSGIAALYFAAFIARRGEELGWIENERAVLLATFLVAANFLTLWILSFEWIAIVESDIIEASRRTESFATSLGLTVIWAVYASAGLALGVARRLRWVRVGGLALLAIPILKLFLVDSFELEQGFRVAAFLVLGVLLLAGGLLYQRNSEAIKGFLFEDEDALEQP